MRIRRLLGTISALKMRLKNGHLKSEQGFKHSRSHLNFAVAGPTGTLHGSTIFFRSERQRTQRSTLMSMILKLSILQQSCTISFLKRTKRKIKRDLSLVTAGIG